MINWNTLFIFTLGLAMATAFFGCAPIKQPVERTHFILEPSRTAHEQRDQPIRGILSIRSFHVSPGYRGKELVYKKTGGQTSSDFYNHYFIPPGPMLTQATRNWLDDSGLFMAVVPLGSHKDPDYILEGAVVSMHGDFQDPKEPGAVLRMQFLLLRDTGLEYELVMKKTYQEKVMLEQPGAVQLIQGLNKCLESILTDLERDLDRILN